MSELAMWTETANPSDHPGKHVVRKWVIDPGGAQPTDETMVFGNRPALIAEMSKRGLVFLMRDPADDPVVVGSWI